VPVTAVITYKASIPPLGLGYLASYVRQNLSDVETRIVTSDPEKAIAEFRPDVLGISSVSQNFNKARELASVGKEAGARVVVGGIHISSLPSCLNRDMDVGVVGEGEETFLQLLRLCDGPWNADNLSKVDGIVYHRGDALDVTPPRRPIEPLDQLPLPARDLLENEGNEVYMCTSSGCPYWCTFCASSRFWTHYRRFSAQYVVREIKDLVERYPDVRSIKMFDDLFIADRNRLRQIVERIRSEGLHRKLRFLVSATANLVDDEAVSLLRQMNVTEVGMGLESGCDSTLAYLKRGVTSVADNERAVRRLKDSGIWVTGSFVVGSPSETREDMMKTLDFIKRVPLDSVGVYVLVPYPNTPLWDIAVNKKLISLADIHNVDWSVLNVDFSVAQDRAIILSEQLSRSELKEVFRLFQRERQLIRAKWAIRLLIRQPSKVFNYASRRMHRLS